MRIDDYLVDIHNVCITGHVSPDGDCAGACLALYSYIKKQYADVDVSLYLEPVTDKLAYLHGYEMISQPDDLKQSFDIMFCVDAAALDRIGKCVGLFQHAKKTVNIDHHISNTMFAEDNYVEPDSSSACEVLYGFLDPEKIDRDIAICLYTGIVYDTGVFKYPSTSSHTMRVVSELMKFDIPTRYIIDESFYLKTYNENRIYGYAIFKSLLAFDGKVIYSYITKEKMKQFHVTKSDLEGIVSQMLLTKDVECSVFMYDMDEYSCKVSLRSVNYLDVNLVAQKFGGGGHKRAAGCTVPCSAADIISKILDEIGKYI